MKHYCGTAYGLASMGSTNRKLSINSPAQGHGPAGRHTNY